MGQITGAELVLKCLAVEGVKFVFGIPCPEVDPMLAKLDDYGMRFVPVRHEAAAVHMAEGLYKTTGQVAVALGNPGPGSANLLPGVITARHEGVPVVVITAQHRLENVYPSPPSTFQGQDQLDIFKPAVKWNAPVLSWQRLPEVFRIAMREMWNGRPGPVQIEIPSPVMYELGDESRVHVMPASAYRVRGPEASNAQLEAAATMLANAQHPVIFAGGGIDRAQANEALLEIVKLLNCPVIGTMAGRSSVPLDHPNALFGYSIGADMARREADVILAAGSRVGNLDIPYDKYWGDPSRQKLIQIDFDQRNMGVTRPLTLGIVSEVRTALEGLLRILKGKQIRSAALSEAAKYREASRKWMEERFASVEQWKGPTIHPARAIRMVGEVFGGDAIYVTDGGMTSLWSAFSLPSTKPRSYLNILELGMLGTGIPSAIGAKLGNPSREVVCVSGDGAAGFNFMEMQSAAREKLRLRTVVMAEGSWTMEEPNERLLWGRTFGTEMGPVRWDLVAEGLGCRGFYAESMDALETALRSARDTQGPAVICIRSNRDANLAIPQELMMRFVEVYQGPMGQ